LLWKLNCPLTDGANPSLAPANMHAIAQFVVQHGYAILFTAVFARQIGLPVPANLFVVAAGAIAASGKLALVPVVVLAVIACLLADSAWYEAGRLRGNKVLHFIHRLTRDPDAHDRRAKLIFAKYGPPILVLAKFVPGLDLVAPPLAGVSRTSWLRFLTFEALGACLWSVAYSGLGYVFSNDLNRAAAYAGRVGWLVGGLAVVGFAIYAMYKLLQLYRVKCEPCLSNTSLPIPVADTRRVVAISETLQGFDNAN